MIFKKKAAQDISSPRMKAQSARLADLKQQLDDGKRRLGASTAEAKGVIAEVSEKLKRGLKKLDPKLGLFTTMRDEGVIFVDFRGEIIHVNHAAAELLNKPVTSLLHKRIDHILTGQRKRKISIEECSKLIIEKANESDECSYDKLCETARTAYLLKTSDVEMHLDEPVCIVLKSGDSINPLRVVISLLDTSPKELEDVTFLCRISQIVGSPPEYKELAQAIA